MSSKSLIPKISKKEFWLLSAPLLVPLLFFGWPALRAWWNRPPAGTLMGNQGSVEAVAFSPNGRLLASAHSDINKAVVGLWDTQTGRLTKTLRGHVNAVVAVAFSPNGKLLASGAMGYASKGNKGDVKIWDVKTGKMKWTLKGHTTSLSSVTFSPDGKALASSSGGVAGGNNGEAILWNTQTGKVIRRITHGKDAVAFSPDGDILATGSSTGHIMLWNVGIGHLLRTLRPQGRAERFAFSPDGRILACGTTWPVVQLWDVKSGQLLQTLPQVNRLPAFSPDGQCLATATWREIQFWESSPGTQTPNYSLASQFEPNMHVSSLALSSDGEQFACGGASMNSSLQLHMVSDLKSR